jgi:hypothetical protein
MSALLLLLACKVIPPDPPKDQIPEAPGTGTWKDAQGKALFTYGDNLVRSGETDHRLYVVAGEKTVSGYRASALAEYVLESEWYEQTDWKLGAPCQGELIIDDHTLSITTSGTPTCDALAGVYTAEPLGLKQLSGTIPKVAGAPECQAYTDCVCSLSINWSLKASGTNNPFSEGCNNAKSLLTQGVQGESECSAGRSIMSSVATEVGLALPEACL